MLKDKKSHRGPECPECSSKQVLYRLTKKLFICRVCGKEWARDDKKKS
jgi:ribosomal protein L37AE/L43A